MSDGEDEEREEEIQKIVERQGLSEGEAEELLDEGITADDI